MMFMNYSILEKKENKTLFHYLFLTKNEAIVKRRKVVTFELPACKLSYGENR